MKEYILFFCTIIGLSYASIITCCPCEFSPEDQRPFFEQYEDTPIIPQEKEEE